MIESALVYDRDGKTLYFRPLEDCSPGYIPDSRSFWLFLWEHRDVLGGVAHVHPYGTASPSPTDTSTFSALERGLGKRLVWAVVTFTEVGYFAWDDEKGEYSRLSLPGIRVVDVDELRAHSRREVQHG